MENGTCLIQIIDTNLKTKFHIGIILQTVAHNRHHCNDWLGPQIGMMDPPSVLSSFVERSRTV